MLKVLHAVIIRIDIYAHAISSLVVFTILSWQHNISDYDVGETQCLLRRVRLEACENNNGDDRFCSA